MNPIDAIQRPAIYPDHPAWAAVLQAATERVAGHGDLARWRRSLNALPDLSADVVTFEDAVRASSRAALDPDQQAALESALRGLHPWRKGPFELFGLGIDTEWRSDWKWERIAAALGRLDGQQVLDVGCGNGYFGWRLLGAGAAGVLGVDPTVIFFIQHLALCRYLGGAVTHANPAQSANFLLPIPFENLPVNSFDLVLSMGVVYHRPDPLAHVQALHDQTRPGGRVLLESLVVTDGPDLHPADADQPGSAPRRGRGRYARMRNVHVVPRLATMTDWLARVGFEDIVTVDVSPTTTSEQRSTDWMTFESLEQCLDPDDPKKTVEGYPSPVRAALLGRRPG
ncbi:MAG: tRNA 5-methoxyuridine(34)/uridine 5-oxyacetic acid(34) synthase CmoB [Gammaproteobacteria bacterium]|nr:MAG: tRNA 5-methoxyuridine(34)/uridine 5-oxyacetic acid(34) synthase CmoB [Gammaproteobacteria bacterium]